MKTLKKNCHFCDKTFLTYDESKTYCNNDCISREKYFKIYPKQLKIREKKFCVSCGEECERKFCNKSCQRKFDYRKELEKKPNKNKEDFLKEKKDMTKINRETQEKMKWKQTRGSPSWTKKFNSVRG